MHSERRSVAGEAAKSRKRLGVSWTAVFTLVLGLAVNSSIAVSYTHLDVYKRQF